MHTQDLLEWGSQNNPNPGPLALQLKPEKEFVKLYDYQDETKVNFIDWFNSEEQEALIALTVGLGKTITASACVDYVLTLGKKVLWLTHRDELITQSASDLEKATGVFCSVEKAEKKASQASKLVVASIQSLKGARLEKLATWFDPDLIVCDEAHHALAQTWMAVKTTFSECKVLNLTATPYRSDVSTRLNLGRVLIEKNTTDGIKMGKLVPPKPVGKIEIDLGKVKKALGDYEVGALSKVLCKPQIIQAGIELLVKHLNGRRGIVFAASVEHGKLLADKLKSLNIEFGEVYGTTPTDVRKSIYARAKTTPNYLIINNLVLTEGFNLPALDLVAIFRPTKNAALYLQMLGRGLRVCSETNKKECLLIDVIDTAKRKTAEGGYILPSEEDRRKYSSLTGRGESIGSTFFSWFFHKTNVEEVIKGEKTIPQCDHLHKGEQVYSLFFSKPTAGWRSYQLKVITKLEEVFDKPGKEEADPTDMGKIFQAIRCGNVDAFVHLSAKSGWRYFPHQHFPENLKLLEEQEEALELKLGDTQTDKAFNFQALISEDAELRNFIMDIFGDEVNLADQAKKYYDLFRIEGVPIVWYRPFQIAGADFNYIEPKKGLFWVRTEDGIFYTFTAGGGFISERPNSRILLSSVPVYNQSTQWANEPITAKQAIQVAKILHMDLEEVQEAHISRLSASAVMSSAWAKKYLVKITNWLKKNHKITQPLPNMQNQVELEVVQQEIVTTTNTSSRQFKKTV